MKMVKDSGMYMPTMDLITVALVLVVYLLILIMMATRIYL